MVIKLSVRGYHAIVILIYRPEPSAINQYTKSQFFNELNDLLAEYHHTQHDLIIMGDFNIHVNKPLDPMSIKLADSLEVFDLKQWISEPTHTAGNTLDLVITRQENSWISSCIVDELISDHNAIQVNLDINKPPRLKKSITTRKTRNINFHNYRRDLKAFLAEQMQKCDENSLDALISIYERSSDVLDKHAPLIERTITLREPTPWNTDDIKKAKIAKRKAEKRWLQTRNESDLTAYKQERNAFNQLLIKLKKDNLKDKIQKHKGNSKALYKVINQSLNRKQSSPLPHNDSDYELAQDFAKFFEEK